jgi:ankyrin repeat protein
VLHKIVLGLFPSSLTTQLDLSTAQINTIDANGRTCLSWAAARGEVTALNTLLAHGADPRIVDMEGNPPIFHAIRAESLPCVSSLISSTVNLRTVDVFGGTALHIACAASDNPAMLKVLVEEGHIDMNAIDYDGDTALNYAARARFDNNARFLLDAGADPNIANVAGETVLHMAIYWNALGILEELVIRGIDFRLVNSRGETLLHTVASHFDSQILKILRRATSLKDVDPYAVNIDGHTCIDRLTTDGDEIGSAERVTAFQEFLNGIGNDVESDNDCFEDAAEYVVV